MFARPEKSSTRLPIPQQERRWNEPSMTRVVVSVENVNTHKPEWFPEPVPNETVEIEEELEETDFVVLKVNARDQDVGSDNSRIRFVR